MQGAHSISTRRAYGVQRVCRVWHRARSSVYARRQATTSPCRRGPVLTKAGGEVLITNDPQVVKGWRVDQILTSELFGLETTRAPRVEAALSERRRLLDMTRRTPAQNRRLEEIEAELRNLPTAEFQDDQAAMEIVRRAAELVKKRESGA